MHKAFHIFISIIVVSIFHFDVHAQNSDSLLRSMKHGHYKPDSSVVYQIPFKPDKKIRLVQGYHGIFSHNNEYASDFRAKPGTPICASREGVVIKTKSDSKVGGLKRRYLSKGNHIIIEHADSTYAAYWHLKFDGVSVEVGDTIEVGEVIGFSGNTGYSAFAHLHFMVYKYADTERKTVPIRFKTQKGICYLRPGRKYCRPIAVARKE